MIENFIMKKFSIIWGALAILWPIVQLQIASGANVTINQSGNWTQTAPTLNGTSNADVLFSGSGGASTNDFSGNLTTVSGITFTASTTGNYSVNANGLSIGNSSVTTGNTYGNIVSAILQSFRTAVDGNLTISDTGYVANSSNYTHSVGNFTISNNALLIVDGSSNTIFSGNSTSGSNSTNLAKIGSGNLTIAGDLTVARIAVSGGAISVPTGGYLHNPSFESDDNNTIGVGINGNGTLNLDGGTIRVRDLGISYNGTGTVNVNSGTLDVRNDLGIGNGGTGMLNLTGGNIYVDDDLYVGDGESLGYGTGIVTVSGGNLTVHDNLGVGSYGAANGTMTITNGAAVSVNGTVSIGMESGASGTLAISGGSVAIHGYDYQNFKPDFYIGYNGTGTLNISGGNITNFLTTIAHNAGSLGIVNVSNGTWDIDDDLNVGGNGTGVLNLTGGDVTSWGYTFIGLESLGNGTVNVNSGNWTNTFLAVGSNGTGTLNITEGSVSNNSTVLGYNYGSSGLVNVSGGNLTIGSHFYIGNNGSGTLNITGGNVTSGLDGINSSVGYNVGSNGLVNVSAGTWNIRDDFSLGGAGNGTLNVSGGNITTAEWLIVGEEATGKGVANVSGGRLSVDPLSALVVGYDGNGTLTLTGNGVVSVGNSEPVYLAKNATSSVGILNIGYGTTAGTLLASAVTGGNGTAIVNFNHTGSYTFSPNLTGSLSVNKFGNGTTVLTGINTYTGITTINSGTLQIGNGGTTGAIMGDLVIAQGAVWSVNRTGNFTYAGNTTGNGSVRLTLGNGTLVLTGNNTARNTTINSGTLQVGAGGASGSIAGDIEVGAGANLAFNRSDAITFGGDISGNGTLTKNGTGTLTLTGDNTYTGNTIINSGTLQMGNGIADGGMDSQNYIINSILVYNYTGNDSSFSGNASGSGSLIRNGSGNLRLGSNLAFTGGTTLNYGATYAESTRALGNGSVTLSNNATLGIGAIQYAGLNSTSSANLTLQVNGNFTWASPNSTIVMGQGAKLEVTGALLNGGVSGNRTFDLNKIGTGLGNYTIATFGSSNFSVSNFLAKIAGNLTGSGFSMNGTALTYSITSIPEYTMPANSTTIDNASIPAFATFNATAEANLTVSDDQILNGFKFTNNGSLNLGQGKTLTLTSGNISVGSGSATISNGTVYTPGNFTKTGSGELKVASNLSVNGSATVDTGLLSVNGELSFTGSSRNLTVSANGRLGGNGTIAGNVFVAGRLAPGNSPGNLTISNGTLTQNASSITDIEIGSLSVYDSIRVIGGGASINGTLNLIPYNTAPYNLTTIPYGSYAILSASGNITGNFTSISINGTNSNITTNSTVRQIFTGSGSRQSFVYSGTSGSVLVAPESYTSVAVTQNQRNVAGALDSFITSTEVDKQTVSTALDRQTAEEYPTSFNQIAPGFYESLTNMAIEQAFNQNQLLNQRTSSVRLGIAGFQAMGGLSQPLLYDKDGKSAAQAKTGPIVQNAMATNWNAWVLGTGMFSRTTSIANVQNYNNNAGGFLLGADYRWNENFVTGLYAGYEFSEAKYAGGSSTKGNTFNFGSYASYENDGYYADAVVGGGFTTYETQRAIKFSTIDRKAKADPNSGQFTAGVNFGKDWKADKFIFGPVIGAHYTFANIGGFKESGADSLNLAIGQQDASSFRTTLGGRLAYNWDINKKITLIPEVRLSWMHEFMNNPRNITSKLDGGNGSSFNYETTAPYRDSANAAIGVTAQFNKTISSSVFYNVNFGSQSYQSNTISIGLNFAF